MNLLAVVREGKTERIDIGPIQSTDKVLDVDSLDDLKVVPSENDPSGVAFPSVRITHKDDVCLVDNLIRRDPPSKRRSLERLDVRPAADSAEHQRVKSEVVRPDLDCLAIDLSDMIHVPERI